MPELRAHLALLTRYDMYKPGKDMILADTLSRPYVNANPESGYLEEDLICAVNLIVSNLPVSYRKSVMPRNKTPQ